MKAVTSLEFQRAVEIDPDWATRLTEPLEVADFCDMAESKITHLSPLLHFTGKNEDGNSANFYGCRSLKVSEGKFAGHVSFSESAIEKIGYLDCGKNNEGYSASFWGCKSLKVAEGNFEGFITFHGSSIEKIGDLSCGKNNQGFRLNVEKCPNLTKIPLTFNPKEIYADPILLEKLEVDRFIQKKRAEIVEIEL